MGKAKDKKQKTVQVAFRLPESMLDRIDDHAKRLTAANPGLEFVCVDAVRSLLGRALDEVEAEADTKRRTRS
jgi:hypothetical protein